MLVLFFIIFNRTHEVEVKGNAGLSLSLVGGVLLVLILFFLFVMDPTWGGGGIIEACTLSSTIFSALR